MSLFGCSGEKQDPHEAWKELNSQAMSLYRAGEHQRGIELATEALKVLETHFGADHASAARSWLVIGHCRSGLKEFDAAEAGYRQAIAINDAAPERNARDGAAYAHSLGKILSETDRFDEAETLLEWALAERLADLGDRHRSTASTMITLGSMYVRQARFREAIPYFESVLAIEEQSLGPDHLDLAGTRHSLGNAYAVLGVQLDRAERLLTQALEVRERKYKPDRPALGHTLNSLGYCHRLRGDLDKAAECYERALAIREKRKSTLKQAITTANNLAIVRRKQHRYPEAEALYSRALDISDQIFDPTDQRTLSTISQLVRCLIDQDKLEDSELLAQRLLDLRRSGAELGEQSSARLEEALGRHFQGVGDQVRAEPHLRAALAIELKKDPEHNEAVAGLSGYLVNALRVQGRFEEAEEHARRSLEVFSAVNGEDDPTVATALSGLGGILFRLEKYDEGQEVLRRCLAARERIYGVNHDRTASTAGKLGEMYRANGDLDSAAPMYARMFEIFFAEFGADSEVTQGAADRLVDVYRNLGREVEAAAIEIRMGASSAGG